MSPISAWRPRRERTHTDIARDYEQLKPDILRTLKRKLAARGVHFDEADLDAFYNQAWHGVYTRLAAGEAIENRGGLVVTIAERRALDEVRSLHADRRAAVDELDLQQVEPDLAALLDDQLRLSRFIEGLRDRLTVREQQAAALCYVHEYTRPEAARLLGVSPRRMEKLMDSVSKKVGALLSDIKAGEWCEQRESLINAYALGLLDINGARYVLAVAHLADCPACRHRVLRMRGLAALTPPAPAVLAALGAGATGSSGGAAGRARHARRARQAGLTAAAAGALTVTALAAVRLADDPPAPTDRASDAGGAPPAGASSAAGGRTGSRPGSAAAPASTATAAPRETRTPRPTATPQRSRPKRRQKQSLPPPRTAPTPAAPTAVATAPPVVTPPPAAPPTARPPRDTDGAGEFELR